jgi:hypothetical protein
MAHRAATNRGGRTLQFSQHIGFASKFISYAHSTGFALSAPGRLRPPASGALANIH